MVELHRPVVVGPGAASIPSTSRLTRTDSRARGFKLHASNSSNSKGCYMILRPRPWVAVEGVRVTFVDANHCPVGMRNRLL